MPPPPRVVHGDCLEIMKMLPDNSVDSIVTETIPHHPVTVEIKVRALRVHILELERQRDHNNRVIRWLLTWLLCRD